HATWPAHGVHYRRGTFMAYGDWFEATFEGPGGHASQPQLAGNPIEAGAAFVAAARDLVGQLSTPQETTVATVTEFLMGNTVNVIPDRGSMRGTLRTVSPERRDALVEGLRDAVAQAAAETRTTGRFRLLEGYPAVVNDPEYVDRMVAALERSPAARGLTEMAAPSMVIEDFAYFLQRWPGAMVYLGASIPGRTAFNHAPDADFDEAVMATGLALHLMAAGGAGPAWG
ncbi:MAG TPA: M20/M25/M40 family metallo-hydrolase, partial [Acidimicrobiales bacterium]